MQSDFVHNTPKSTAIAIMASVGTTISGFCCRVLAVNTANTAKTNTRVNQANLLNNQRANGEMAFSHTAVRLTPLLRTDTMSDR